MHDQDIHTFYTYLQSQETARNYLYQCYRGCGNLETPEANSLSYQNTSRFMYNLEHGSAFYADARKCQTLLRPILYFYGMVHLLKASLITVRPYYPESTKMLAHGVSTRKRKKKQYSFLKDEVKVQHQGLFPYVSEHLFQIRPIPFEKIAMEQLITLIPELAFLHRLEQREGLIKVGKVGSRSLHFPANILDDYYLSANAFINRVKTHTPPVADTKVNSTSITIELKLPISDSSGPFFTDEAKGDIYFPRHRSQFIPISEVMVHYLLLYNLSMLSRYESQWWGELLTMRPDIEYPVISRFLDLTADKMPLLLGRMLLNKAVY